MTGVQADTFVGRAGELQSVASALSDPTETTRVICVSGPAGIGKTALASRALDNGSIAHWTRCWNGPGTPSLWPWTQLLDSLGVDRSADDDQSNTPVDRFAQFERISDRLRMRSLDAALHLVIDDIHWADRTSLELLHFIARDRRPSNLRIIATYRDNEAEAGESANIISSIERDAHSVRLDGLSAGEVSAIGHRVGVTAAETIASVTQRTNGNPFFATELLRQIASDVSATTAIPTSVRSLLQSQFELIDDATRNLLECAAVQGQRFDADTLIAATKIDPFDVDEMLADARRRRLVAREPSGWRFEHALVGETLLDALTPHQIALHHLSTADAIEKRFGVGKVEHVESVANHLAAAGTVVAPQRLIDTCVEAAGTARRQLAFETESRFLETAATALRTVADRDIGSLVDVLVDRCVAEKSMGRFATARDVALEAADHARSSNDVTRFGTVALVFPPDAEGVELDQVYDPDQERLREEALAVVPAEQPAMRAQLLAAHAISLYWTTTPGDAAAHRASIDRRDELTAEAMAIAERLDDDRTLAIAVRARLYANWGPATDDERLGLALRLTEIAERLGDGRLALEGRVWRIADHQLHGRLIEAEVELDSFQFEAERLHDRYQQWSALRIRSNLAFMRGDIVRSSDLNRRALEFGSEFLPNDAAFHFYSAALGPPSFIQGVMGDAVDFVRDMASQNPHVPAWRIGYALSAADSGDLDAARAELEAVAADDFAMVPRDLDFSTSMSVAAAVAQKTQHRAIGKQIAALLEHLSGLMVIHGIGYTSYGCFDLILGECADAAGDTREADRLYSAAIDQLDPTGSPYAAYARLLRGSLLAASDPQRSRRDLSEAIDRYVALDAPPMVEVAEAARAGIDSIHTVRLTEVDAGWRLVRHDADTVELPALKGFRALQELVVHPQETRHALVLASLIEGHGGVAPTPEGRIDLADDAALAAYRSRLTELGDRLDDADLAGDVERSEALQAELDALTDELQRSQGFGGRRATSTGSADRARVNVTKHLKRAIERITEVDSELGADLRNGISTGMHCAYHPGGGSGTIWSR